MTNLSGWGRLIQGAPRWRRRAFTPPRVRLTRRRYRIATRSPRLGEDRPLSGGFPSVDPLLEQGDALLVPRAVARHRAVADAVQDRVALAGDVVIRPEVDKELHRPAVTVSEQRLDVAVEADGLVVCGHLGLPSVGVTTNFSQIPDIADGAADPEVRK